MKKKRVIKSPQFVEYPVQFIKSSTLYMAFTAISLNEENTACIIHI